MDLKSGDRFDRYTIEDVLGQGGMGRVYRAYDERLQRRIALKLLRPDASDPLDTKERGSARLLREARAAAALEHVNAIAIHDVGEVDGTPYIAMELVDGTSLRAHVGAQTPGIDTRVRWLLDVARALDAAHARGLVHRDIKPENVMVRRDGVIKVLDFGIARTQAGGDERGGEAAIVSARAETWGTESAFAGTPRYMAPEQLRREPLDARIDQFAWGVLAYELLTGRPPWGDGGHAVSLTLLQAILDDAPASAEPLARVAPPHVVSVVLRALSKRRDARFPSMGDVVRALEGPESGVQLGAADADAPSVAPASTAPGPFTTLRRARPRATTIGVALAAAIAVGAPLALFAARRKPVAPPGIAASASAPASPVKLTDLPTPASDVAEAKAAYVAGIHAIHDASVAPGVRQLVRATELDSSMAAAHLRIVAYGGDITTDSDPRAHFTRARELHALLTPHDQALLAAFEPAFLSVPPDQAEVTRRLRELAERWPRDVEIQYLASAREPNAAQIAAMDGRVLALDPEFALALWRKAVMQLASGDVASTSSTLDRCIAVASSSTACLTVRALVYEELGRCADMERDARVLELLAPSPRTHDLVARVLFANGAPLAAVREALGRKWASAANDQERDAYRLDDEAHLAVLAGDFQAAERLELSAAAKVERSVEEEDHKDTTVPLVMLYGEMGDARAGRLADKYLAARAGWQSAGAWSPVPRMYGFAVRAGLRTEAERRAAREAWRAEWDGADAWLRPQWWVQGWAMPAETEADGVDAMAVAPDPLPRPHLNQFHREGIGAVGKALLLAGRAEEAVPLLRAAAATCSALPAPLDHTWAHLRLGQALEKTGDAPGACEAYRVVVDRWGAAKPRSVSADAARARRAALACK